MVVGIVLVHFWQNVEHGHVQEATRREQQDDPDDVLQLRLVLALQVGEHPIQD